MPGAGERRKSIPTIQKRSLRLRLESTLLIAAGNWKLSCENGFTSFTRGGRLSAPGASRILAVARRVSPGRSQPVSPRRNGFDDAVTSASQQLHDHRLQGLELSIV